MKRLLALLLVLMLPLSALANSTLLTMELYADQQVFPVYAQALLQSIWSMSAEDAVKCAKALSAVMENLRLDVITQEDAVSFDVKLYGSSLFDMTIWEVGDAAYISSSLLPGYTFYTEAEGEATAAVEKQGDAAVNAQEVLTALDEWLIGLPSTTSQGVFHGDAYEDGAACTTWVLEDKDIAALVTEKMDPSIRAMLGEMLITSDAAKTTPLELFDALSTRVANENAYRYVLRKVHDQQENLIGLSCTVMKDASQLATISLGMEEDAWRLVIGLGLNSQNYWWEYQFERKEREHLTLVKGESREWTADKLDAFAFVKETCVPAAASVWHCNLTESGSRLLWDGSVYEGETTASERKTFSFSGTLNPTADTMKAEFAFVYAGYTPLKVSVSSAPGGEIPPRNTEDQICDVSSEADQTLYETLYAQLSLELVSRLMTMLPLDVILTLGEILGA